jgi:hypothetical protein
MTKRIAHLLKEQEDQSKLLRTSYLDVEDERTQEDIQYMFVQKSRALTSDREEVLLSNRMKESQQREVTMLSTDKNQNGKRNPVMHITGENVRNLSKKREKIEKLQKVPEGTLQKEGLQNCNFVGISEQRKVALLHGGAI